MSTFYLVEHKFKPDASEAWWASMSEMMKDAQQMKAFHAKVESLGFYNHSFNPTGLTSNAWCFWEASAGKTAANFQDFIDGPEGPSMGAFVNNVFPISMELTGGATPYPSYFSGKKTGNYKKPMTVAPGPEPSKFFMVRHDFKPNQEDQFWGTFAKLAGTPGAMEKWSQTANSLGFFNHSFNPVSKVGPCFCVWETAPGKTAADMQAYIDSCFGPPSGMVNVVSEINVGLTNGQTPYTRFFGDAKAQVKASIETYFTDMQEYNNHEAKFGFNQERFEAAWDKSVDDGAEFIRPSGNPLDKAGFIAMRKSGMVTGLFQKLVSVDDVRVLPGGLNAYARYIEHAKFEYDGKQNDDMTTWTSVFTKKGPGMWKMVAGQRSTGRQSS